MLLNKNVIAKRQEGYFQVINEDPYIIMLMLIQDAEKFLKLECLKNRKIYFLIRSSWTLELQNTLNTAKKCYHNITQQYSNVRITFLCNTLRESELLKKENINNIFCNQITFVDENRYKILCLEKKYDAIYNARMSKFKRHELAEKIKSLALINSLAATTHDSEYYKKIRKILNHAEWLNYTTGKWKNIESKELSQYLNQSKIGIILSDIEGSNYATVEYMLCGLPVVSTKSIGGREIYFDNENSIISEDNPESVKDSITKLIEKNIQPNLIRNKILSILYKHRKIFIQFIQNIYEQENILLNFEEEFKTMFFDKFLTWNKISKENIKK